MPLHLLGKKSWNVYNQPNIDRVRRDESEAAAREEAEEQRQQENDAARRLAILRGEEPPPLLLADESRHDGTSQGHQRHSRVEVTGENSEPTRGETLSRDHHGRRKRKRHGEDDTDFEMRLAQEQVGSHGGGGDNRHGDDEPLSSSRRYGESKGSDAPIVDHAGHIDLFPDERDRAQKDNERRLREDKRKNPDAEREKARNKRELEDQYTMRFSNAAGRDVADHLTSGKGPWYAGSEAHFDRAVTIDNPRKNAFGREDPSRKARDELRVEANDPLAMMKRGAAKVREVEKERQNENEEREREAKALRREERKRQKRRRRHGDKNDLEGDEEPFDEFSLDQTHPAHNSEQRSRSHRNDRGHSHKHRNERDENRVRRHRDHGHSRA
ncbi:N-terminal domain of CBF1 interacting co-repressor CIR [Microdochium nivale]|nr:N-terminal domain of CBF1 interacting co-repressor CIR [Microdochium nivale]